MRNKALLNNISKHTNVDVKICSTVLNSFIYNVRNELVNKGIAKVINFGSFKLVINKERRMFSFGKFIEIGIKRKVKFTASKKLMTISTLNEILKKYECKQ